ncbi:amino acid adenylation domain-containing protein/natural product biosynthesis luciferase-like monooxygenase domain-containing protein [Streptomyces sp. WMMB 714]|uniref:non-ribosomal peptide synthetase n=1 Tax=Streptomyces sp. WMMB 714 TaxID=1286822 RepID=UPI0006979636|nr:non-ribosomal peptide synthetase [Streptomyces sp. WMMB 714]SCK47635.1 amino acid adenylation domain-containing protein/natural product biosynthesis luciferase-like monooxygenase domain-containing protein [Streptomyces sp. WMMB 714]
MSTSGSTDLTRLTALAAKITDQIAQLKATEHARQEHGRSEHAGSEHEGPSTVPGPVPGADPDSDLAPALDPAPAPESRHAPESGHAAGARVHGPRVTVSRDSSMASAVPASRGHVDELVERFTARTARSKALAGRYRPVLADSRATVGFRNSTKEMLYPLAARHAKGARLTDVDGNEYVDITMGFGTLLFGHEPDFLTEAVSSHLSRGLRLGPRSPETGEAAELLTGMTGLERVAFATSGTEANASAFRLARAATGRSKIVVFHGAYHGHADATLGRSVGKGADRRTVPLSPGVPEGAMADLIVLDYGAPESLDTIAEHADEIAAVAVEPVQSRNPSLQPVEFVRKLRELTSRTGIVLLFDEMLTGLRPHPRGAQELYGVVPDLATYGKLLGGGFPIGAVAGRADLLDGVDGGQWQYGDDSYPERETTFFGGTYLQHPLAMTAACAVLRRLSEEDGEVQRSLNSRTGQLTDRLNRFFEEEEFPLRAVHYGSMFRFEHRADLELLYHHLVLRGVYVWEWRNFFLSTAHSDDDIAFVERAVADSLRELRGAGFFPRRKAARTPARTSPASPPRRAAPDVSLYFFGDYPEQQSAADAYDTITEAARFADEQGFHALWLPERHFHSFGGVFPNPSVLAAALARETARIRINAGSVVLPLHDPLRVAEEWSVVDNLSRGRVGLGCAGGWNARDFAFFPERFGSHRESMYEQVADVRALWSGQGLRRRTGADEADLRIFPRPFQRELPMYTAIVGNPESYRKAGHHDLGVVTNLMGQSPEQLAENIALYRRARAERDLDPDAGRVTVLLHTYLADDHAEARATAYKPLFRYMRSSLSLFGQMTSSLGRRVDLASLSEDDLDAVFSRAYERYCDQRALIGSPQQCLPVVDALRAAGVDEVAALLDFGVPHRALLEGLPRLNTLRQSLHGDVPQPGREAISVRPSAAQPSARERSGGPPPVEPSAGELSEGAPLSPGQRRIWILEQLLPGRSAYNEPAAIPLDGPLDTDALREALSRLTERHEVLRTVFRTEAAEPMQYVLPHAAPELPVVDCPESSEAAAMREALAEESERRFDLERGPLFQTRLLRLGEQRHVLVLSFHHIVVDGVSAGIVTRDLSALYRAARSGTRDELPELPLTYRDISRRQAADARADDARDGDLAYWKETLSGELPVLDLPTDRPRPPRPSARGRSLHRTLPPELVAGLRKSGRSARATLFMTLLSGYAAMLREVSGQEDIVIGTPVSDRPEGTHDLVGFFVNTLALRLDCGGDPTFRQLLERVRSTALDAYDHSGTPFDTVVNAVAPPREDTSRAPVFQVMAEYESGPPFLLDLPGVTARPAAVGADKALVDLTVYFSVTGDSVECRFEYSTDLFDEATVAGFAARFERILRAAAADPSVRLAAPRTGASAEGTARPVEDTTVHELFARQARRDPGRPAVSAADCSLSYGELDERAERLAESIRGLPVDGGPPVALWLPRSAGFVVAALAVLKTGRACLPLDPALGPQRVTDVLEDSGARIVLTNGDAPALPPLPEGVTTFDTGGAADTPAGSAGQALASVTAASDGASETCCLIYTSGSEGRPKGIGLSHRGLVNLVQWHHSRFGTGPGTRGAVVCSQSFDASLLEIWPVLAAGGSLAVAGDEVRLDPRALSRWYAREGITFTMLPTALAEEVLALPPDQQPPLRHLVCGGEQLTRRPHAGAPYGTVNVYGPSEVTVLATTHTVPAVPADGDDGPIPIGYPIDNTRLDVLDAEGRPVPAGAVGELHITGPGVALGYHSDPELTAERFVPTTGGVRYRTGDLVEVRPDGALVFRGRADDQVKISGFRVEPAEPDRALRGLPGVRNAAVVARRDPRRGSRLVGYVVPEDAGRAAEPSYPAELERQLDARLPHYMVPREWAVLPGLPLNVNGKLDRSALPPGTVPALAPPRTDDAGAAAGGPDVEATLRKLWADALGADTEHLADDVSFFSAGGDSLSAIRLVGRAVEEFATDYPVVRFFEQPTLRAMTGYLTGSPGPSGTGTSTGTDPGAPDPADAGAVEERAPATREQTGMVMRHEQTREPQVWNVALRLRCEGPLDVPALRRALEKLIHRHHALRSRYAWEHATASTSTSTSTSPGPGGAPGAGEPEPGRELWQEVLAPRPVPLPVEDLREVPPPERAERLETECDRIAQTPFDVARSVQPRVRLFRTGDESCTLMLVLHHISCDGWSVSVLLKEFGTLYGNEAGRLPLRPLPAPTSQCTDYARLQASSALSEEEHRRRVDFWADRLAGCRPDSGLPADHPRPAVLSGRGDTAHAVVPAELFGALRDFARETGTTPYAVMLAVLGRLLHLRSGREETVLSTAYANRAHPSTDTLVTCTATILILRLRTGGDETLPELCRQVTSGFAEGVANFIPYARIREGLSRHHGIELPNSIPLGATYQNSIDLSVDLPGVSTVVTDQTGLTARRDCSFSFLPCPDGTAEIHTEFSTDLYEPGTVEGWLAEYAGLADAMLREARALPPPRAEPPAC